MQRSTPGKNLELPANGKASTTSWCWTFLVAFFISGYDVVTFLTVKKEILRRNRIFRSVYAVYLSFDAELKMRYAHISHVNSCPGTYFSPPLPLPAPPPTETSSATPVLVCPIQFCPSPLDALPLCDWLSNYVMYFPTLCQVYILSDVIDQLLKDFLVSFLCAQRQRWLLICWCRYARKGIKTLRRGECIGYILNVSEVFTSKAECEQTVGFFEEDEKPHLWILK